MKPVIYTDLDGTLLDSGYSYSAAEKTLERVRSEAIPLVLVTSKTRAEVEEIRLRMRIKDPFVTENGGGVFIPCGYFPFPVEAETLDGYSVIKTGVPYGEIRSALEGIRKLGGRSIRGFGDMSEQEVARLTGLTVEAARLAKMREFDEPIVAEGGLDGKTAALIESRGLFVVKGKLLHVTGSNDKGKAVDILNAYFKALYGKVASIGIGNGPGDAALLAKVDYPVLVKNEGGGCEDIGLPGLIKADGIGPEGWAKAVTGILDTIKGSAGGYTC